VSCLSSRLYDAKLKCNCSVVVNNVVSFSSVSPKSVLHLHLFCVGWQHSSVVRMSIFDRQTFPNHVQSMATGDHFVGKLFVMGQRTRPTQPSVPLGLVSEL